jgi:hypothetical protein
MGLENIGDESEDKACEGTMWKLLPDWLDEPSEDETIVVVSSTEGKGPRSSGGAPSASAGGGVRVCWRGDAV